MSLGWSDSLVHLRAFDEQEKCRFEIDLADNGVTALISAGYSPQRDRQKTLLSIQSTGIQVFHAWGFHPEVEAGWDDAACLKTLDELKPDLIGEVGLDKRCLATNDWRTQEFRAERAIDFAVEFKLPLLWHSVHATGRSLRLIRKARQAGVRGLWHGFHGSEEVAREMIELGWKIGVGPSILRHNANRFREMLGSMPLNGLLIESDWPQANGIYAIEKIGSALAEIRNLQVGELQLALSANFFDLVGSA